MLTSLPERFHAKITTIEESKGSDKIPLIEQDGNLQTYELGLTRIGKGSKSKSMSLNAKSVRDLSLLMVVKLIRWQTESMLGLLE